MSEDPRHDLGGHEAAGSRQVQWTAGASLRRRDLKVRVTVYGLRMRHVRMADALADVSVVSSSHSSRQAFPAQASSFARGTRRDRSAAASAAGGPMRTSPCGGRCQLNEPDPLQPPTACSSTPTPTRALSGSAASSHV